MILTEKQRSLGERFGRASDMQHGFTADAIHSHQPHTARNDLIKARGLITEPKERLSGLKFALKSHGSNSRRHPAFCDL
jgi:hypothetical protein